MVSIATHTGSDESLILLQAFHSSVLPVTTVDPTLWGCSEARSHTGSPDEWELSFPPWQVSSGTWHGWFVIRPAPSVTPDTAMEIWLGRPFVWKSFSKRVCILAFLWAHASISRGTSCYSRLKMSLKSKQSAEWPSQNVATGQRKSFVLNLQSSQPSLAVLNLSVQVKYISRKWVICSTEYLCWRL